MICWQQHSTEIIGILGTLLGTILGWVLGKLNFGKLSIFPHNWTDKFSCTDENGFPCDSSNKKDSKYYEYSFSLDIYNSGDKTKIMRDIEVMFMKDKDICCRRTPKDASTIKHYEHYSTYEIIEPINIPAKTIIKVDLLNGFSGDEFNFIWSVNRVLLQYSDEHNRTKRLLINKKQYSNYFDNCNDEQEPR